MLSHSGSNHLVRTFFLILLLLAAHAAISDTVVQESADHGDIEVAVSLDSGEQSGSATASIRIHARREVVFSLITSCAEAPLLVPGLRSCEVLETAPDGSWQRIRHVIDYSWYVPRLTYEIHATYEPPAKVRIERTSGDLRLLRGSWALQSDGDYTIAHYAVDLAPGFWVPHWLVRAALRRDLPRMLRALRSRAEFVQEHRSG
jgi:ribosome-associated toxin RatA of RatAB toxin-antitoxin module